MCLNNWTLRAIERAHLNFFTSSKDLSIDLVFSLQKAYNYHKFCYSND